MEELKLLSILGVGTFGRVKLVLHTPDSDRPYALKCMRKGQVIALKQASKAWPPLKRNALSRA